MIKKLTKNQERIFKYITDHADANGRPPTVREIMKHFKFRSPNAVTQHLRLIENKGYISRAHGKARGIEIMVEQEKKNDDTVSIPLVGTIAAGSPVTAIENVECSVALDKDLFKGENIFSLRVKGNSMKGIGVLDGDIAVIQQQSTARQQDIVAVIIEEEATLKRFIKENNRVILRAENPEFSDIVVEADKQLHIAGKLIGVIRKC
ncbi:transcriptional repressor LexA [Verrucomicrobiota bacterium]